MNESFEELSDIPLTEQPPPPPPQASQTELVVFKEVPDEQLIEEIKVDLDVEITSDMSISNEIVNLEFEIEEEKAEEVFTIVEFYPEPVGGYEAFYRYIGENLKYPAMARKAGVEGKVFVQFIVEPNGRNFQRNSRQRDRYGM